MTCIVAIKDKDTNLIHIAGDSAASSDSVKMVRSDSKVFMTGKFLMGFAGSFRFGQLIQFGFTPPKHPENKSTHAYMCTDFIKKMHKSLEVHRFVGNNKINDDLPESQLLIAYRNELFLMDIDYHMGISSTNYMAIGGASELALGSLHTTNALCTDGYIITPEIRLTMALNAASEFSTSVAPPYTMLSI